MSLFIDSNLFYWLFLYRIQKYKRRRLLKLLIYKIYKVMSKQNISVEDLKMIFKDSLLAQKRVFNLKDLMSYTGWSDKNIYRLTSLRMIPFTKPTKGSLFFDRLKIEEWLLTNQSPTNKEVDQLVNSHLYKNKKS